MENNGGQSAGTQDTGYAGSAFVKETPKSGKISGLAVVLMIVFLAVGFGGGAVVGGLMAGGTGTADEDGGKDSTDTTSVVTPTTVDTTMQDELDKKIDAYESIKPYGDSIRPFHESYLTKEEKLYAVLNTMKDDKLAGLVAAFKNSERPYETAIAIEDVKSAYESFFGEEMEESDMVDITECGFGGAVTGNFTYDSANAQYKALLPEAAGCGGTTVNWTFSYKDSYSVEGDKAYVTVEVGRSSLIEYNSGVFSDYIGGTKVSDLNAEGALNAEYINESNKDSFTKYQYVFEKQDSGAWALKGLYPTEK